MEMHQRIKAARLAAGLSQEKLGEFCGVSRSAVSQWEADRPEQRVTPTVEKLVQISAAVGRSLDHLISGADTDNAADTVPEPRDRLPIVSWVSAGRTAPVADPYPAGRGSGWLLVQKSYGPGTYALEVRGDSMYDPARPLETFPPGCYIVVDPNAAPANGSYVIARFEGQQEATFKKLVYDAGQAFLEPLNPRYPVIPVREEMTICGVVRQMIWASRHF